MKKLFFALLLAAVALTGCDKDETTDVVLHDVELKASIDLNASRVAFDQGGNFFWTVNDAIGVTTTASKSNFQKMKMKDGGAGQATATFKGSYMSGTPEGYAVYPYNNKHKMNGSELTYNFPTSYNYTIEDHSYFVTDGTGNSFNPAMWATIEDGRVHFKHLGGVFCIAVADMPAGDNQTLTVTTSQRITGDFTTDLAANPVLVTDNEAGNEVTINFSNAEESDRVFYVPVPTGLYEEICIAFEADGELVEVYFENREVKPKYLVKMEIGEFELEGGEAEQAAKQKKALEEVCAAGVGEIKLTSDVTFDQILTIAEPQAVTRAAEAATITIDGNGHKLISTAERAINVATTANVIIKNLTVECTGERGVNVIQKPANVTLENVTMTAANYTVNAAASGAGATIAIKNSTLTGLNVVNIAAPNANVTVDKTTLNCVDASAVEGYSVLALNKDAKNSSIAATGCTFNIPAGSDSVKATNGAEGGAITIDGSTTDVDIDVAIIDYGNNYYGFTTLEAAIAHAADNGETVKLIRDITASEIVVVDKAVTIDGNGHKLTSMAGRAINVSGADGVVIKNLTVECSGERGVNVIQNATNVTLENVTMKAANYTVNAASSAPGAVIAVKNSTLTGLNVVNIAAPNANVTVDKTTLNCVDKNESENYAALTLNKDAVNGVIAATNCTFNIDGESDKAKNGAEGGVITIDGKTDDVVEVNAIIEYGDYYYGFTTLADAIEKAKAGETVKLIRDITASEIVVVNKAITIDGNGHKLTSTAERAINVQTEGNVVIKNLVVECSGERGVNVIQKPANVTLENVTMKAANYTVNAAGSGAGATIAVKNSTLTGKNVVNIGGANVNVTVENTTLNCVDDSAVEGYSVLALNKDAKNSSIAATGCTFNIPAGSDSVKATNAAEGGEITIDGSTTDVDIDVAAVEYGNYYYGFTTLGSAIAHAADKGETVKLIRDIELNASLVLTDEGTLDLNGHSISQKQAQSAAYNMIQNKGNWTIKNGTLDYADVANLTAAVNYVSNTIQNGGSLTLENVKVVNNSGSAVAANGYPHPIDNSGKLVINSGEFTNNANYSSMRIWCTEDTDTEVIINGGTFNGAIDFQNVSAKPNKGTLTINGGTFNPDTYTNAAVRLLGFGVDVDEINGYIKGGTFNGEVKLNKYASGEFNSQVFFVSGGKFKFNPSSFLAEGYTSTQEGDYYVVK